MFFATDNVTCAWGLIIKFPSIDMTENKWTNENFSDSTSSSPSALFTKRITGPSNDDGSAPGTMLSTYYKNCQTDFKTYNTEWKKTSY